MVPFSSCLQSFPVSGSFQMSQLFAPDGQSIGVSASTSVLPMNTQDYLLYDMLVGSPCSPGDSQKSLPTPQFKSINSLVLSFLYSPTLTSIHDTGKTIALTRQTFVSKVISVLFNMLPQFISVAQSCPTLCDPVNRSMPGLPVHHHLPEFTQTHIH